jgi:hypothetical protein
MKQQTVPKNQKSYSMENLAREKKCDLIKSRIYIRWGEKCFFCRLNYETTRILKNNPMATLEFSQVFFFVFDKDTPLADTEFTVAADTVYKIESAGIGGAKGSIFLRNDFGNPDIEKTTKIATLFTSIGDNDYRPSPLPYSLPAGFTGNLFLEGEGVATVSIVEYNIV